MIRRIWELTRYVANAAWSRVPSIRSSDPSLPCNKDQDKEPLPLSSKISPAGLAAQDPGSNSTRRLGPVSGTFLAGDPKIPGESSDPEGPGHGLSRSSIRKLSDSAVHRMSSLETKPFNTIVKAIKGHMPFNFDDLSQIYHTALVPYKQVLINKAELAEEDDLGAYQLARFELYLADALWALLLEPDLEVSDESRLDEMNKVVNSPEHCYFSSPRDTLISYRCEAAHPELSPDEINFVVNLFGDPMKLAILKEFFEPMQRLVSRATPRAKRIKRPEMEAIMAEKHQTLGSVFIPATKEFLQGSDSGYDFGFTINLDH